MYKWLKLILVAVVIFFCFNNKSTAQIQNEKADLDFVLPSILSPWQRPSCDFFSNQQNFFLNKTVVHLDVLIARPNLLVFPTGKKFFCVWSQVDRRVNKNLWLGAVTQINSPYEQNTDWTWHLGPSVKIIPNKNYCLETIYLWGKEGDYKKPDNKFLISWKFKF